MNKLIIAARERATNYGKDIKMLSPKDAVAKVEKGQRESYQDGFRDYHGPRGNAQVDPTSSK